MKRVLYIAPRFHTNQYYPTKSLLDNDIEVKFISRYSHKTENRDIIDPILIGDNFLIKILQKASGRLFYHSIPPFLKLMREVKAFNPDISIIRMQGLYPWLCLIALKVLDVDVILYTQDRIVGEVRSTSLGRLFDYCVQPIKNNLVECEITPISGMRVNEDSFEDGEGRLCHEYVMEEATSSDFLKGQLGASPIRCEHMPLSIRRNRRASYPTYHIPLVIKWMGENNNKLSRLHETRIMMVSEFQPRKRIIETICIVSNLLSKGRYVHLTIIGNADKPQTRDHLEEVRSLVYEKSLEDHVTIMTDIPHEDVLKEYRNNHLFLLTALRESAGYSVLEAMANGAAVMISSDAGLQECIIDGYNGYVFEKDDLQGLEVLLTRLCDDGELLLSLGANNERVVKNLYSPKVYHDYLRYVHDEIKRG